MGGITPSIDKENHLHHLHSLSTCNRLFQNMLHIHNNVLPSSVFHMQDDSFIVEADVEEILGELNRTTTRVVITQLCTRWHSSSGSGNIAAFGGVIAENYFGLPLQHYYSTNIDLSNVKNINLYLMKVYANDEISLRTSVNVRAVSSEACTSMRACWTILPKFVDGCDWTLNALIEEARETSYCVRPFTESLDRKEIAIGQHFYGNASAFVCITGQLERLELDSKLAHIVAPLAERFDQVHVALALSKDGVHFTNMYRNLDQGDFSSSPYSFSSAKLRIMEAGATSVLISKVRHNKVSSGLALCTL